MEYKIVKIKDFVADHAIEIRTGPFGTQLKASEYKATGVPVLNVRNLGYATISEEKLEHIDYSTAERLSAHLLSEGDIVFGRKGAVDRHAYIKGQNASWIQGSDCIRMRVRTELINPRFLSYYFLTKSHRAFMNSICSHGTIMASLNQGILEQITFPLPKRTVQDCIVAMLSKLDGKIAINAQINDNLQQTEQAIFEAWFSEYAPFGYRMPENWNTVSLGAIARISTEIFSPLKNPETAVEHYSIPAYDERRYPIFGTASNIKSNKYRLTKHSVMISKLNPNTKRLWRPYCLSDNPICSTEFIVYEPLNPLYRDFICSIIDSNSFSAFLCAHTTGSTNSRQRATPSVTLEYEIVLPEESVIQEFCSIVTPLYDMMERNILENERLAALRDTLLPRLMSGELDVSGLDI